MLPVVVQQLRRTAWHALSLTCSGTKDAMQPGSTMVNQIALGMLSMLPPWAWGVQAAKSSEDGIPAARHVFQTWGAFAALQKHVDSVSVWGLGSPQSTPTSSLTSACSRNKVALFYLLLNGAWKTWILIGSAGLAKVERIWPFLPCDIRYICFCRGALRLQDIDYRGEEEHQQHLSTEARCADFEGATADPIEEHMRKLLKCQNRSRAGNSPLKPPRV